MFVGVTIWVDRVRLCEIVQMDACGSLCAYSKYSILIAKVIV